MLPPDAQDGGQNSQRRERAFCARPRPSGLDEIDELPGLEGGRLARCVAHRKIAEIAQSVVKQRTTSAKGLTIHLMVKGVSFFTPMSPNTIAAEPLKLTGKFPNGLVDPTGMKPLYEDNIPVRFAIRAAKGCTIIGGMCADD